MVLKVFYSSSSGSTTIKKNQQTLFSILDSLKIPHELKDIAAIEENRKWMRENVPETFRPANGAPLPPQIFCDDHYLGDFEAFFEAKENNNLYTFLGLTPPPGSKEAEALANKNA